jgi:hypothetical protein
MYNVHVRVVSIFSLAITISYEIEIKQNIEDGVNKRRTEVYKGSKRKPIVHKVVLFWV